MDDASEPGVTDALQTLYERSDYSSLKSLAVAMGYADASSIQRYFNADAYIEDHFKPKLIKRLLKALVGQGNPPITEAEIIRLGAVLPSGNGTAPVEDRAVYGPISQSFLRDVVMALEKRMRARKLNYPARIRGGLYGEAYDEFRITGRIGDVDKFLGDDVA